MTLATGTKLGPYEIQSPLGAGGMGEVYRARDTRLERDVAVKVLSPKVSSDPGSRQRLEREAKAVSKLSHPRICTLHDIGHQDGVDFLVMELVEGETLTRPTADFSSHAHENEIAVARILTSDAARTVVLYSYQLARWVSTEKRSGM